MVLGLTLGALTTRGLCHTRILASVVVADLVGGAVLAGVTSGLAHPINTNPVRSTLLTAAADGLADTLITDFIGQAVIWRGTTLGGADTPDAATPFSTLGSSGAGLKWHLAVDQWVA